MTLQDYQIKQITKRSDKGLVPRLSERQEVFQRQCTPLTERAAKKSSEITSKALTIPPLLEIRYAAMRRRALLATTIESHLLPRILFTCSGDKRLTGAARTLGEIKQPSGNDDTPYVPSINWQPHLRAQSTLRLREMAKSVSMSTCYLSRCFEGLTPWTV